MEEKQELHYARPVGRPTGEPSTCPYAKAMREWAQINKDAKRAKKEYEEAVAETKAERGS